MSKIEYIEEDINEVFYRTLLYLDKDTPREEIETRVIEEMRNKKCTFNEDEISIRYETSDSKIVTVEVSKKVHKIVPYKISKEELYSGTFILDGIPMSEEEQRQRVFDILRAAGVEVEDPDSLEIGYEGAEDRESETQTTRFVVSRTKRERLKVEYEERIEREAIFVGTYILDGIPMSEEEQRQRVFDIMRAAGVEVEDPDSLEIGYEGAEDSESETQTTKFVVFRKKTRTVPFARDGEEKK